MAVDDSSMQVFSGVLASTVGTLAMTIVLGILAVAISLWWFKLGFQGNAFAVMS